MTFAAEMLLKGQLGGDFDDGAVACMVGLAIIFWPVALVMGYFNTYADVYPLSSAAGHIEGGAHIAYEIFFWIFAFIGAISSAIPIGYVAYAIIEGCCGIGGPLAVFLSFPGGLLVAILPMCLAVLIGPGMSSRAWNSVCDEFEFAAVLNATTNVGVNVSLGLATVALSAIGNYSMQLVALDTGNLTFSVINSFNYTPPFNTITYNNESLVYTTNATSGEYVVSPQLAFPSLNLTSTAPSYINFEKAGGPALALLSSDHDNQVLYTLNTKHGNLAQLKICGSLQPVGDFQIAMGAVMMQHYLNTLYQQNPPSTPAY
jgi:hypothetical protein